MEYKRSKNSFIATSPSAHTIAALLFGIAVAISVLLMVIGKIVHKPMAGCDFFIRVTPPLLVGFYLGHKYRSLLFRKIRFVATFLYTIAVFALCIGLAILNITEESLIKSDIQLYLGSIIITMIFLWALTYFLMWLAERIGIYVAQKKFRKKVKKK